MKYILILMLLVASSVARSQSFFKPLQKPQIHRYSLSLTDSSAAPITSENLFRPLVNIGSYSIPGNSLLTGAGVSFSHLKFDSLSQKWNAQYSLNALAWYLSPLNGNNSTAFAYGLAGGFFNNLILVGVATDGKKVYGTIGFGINFNN